MISSVSAFLLLSLVFFFLVLFRVLFGGSCRAFSGSDASFSFFASGGFWDGILCMFSGVFLLSSCFLPCFFLVFFSGFDVVFFVHYVNTRTHEFLHFGTCVFVVVTRVKLGDTEIQKKEILRYTKSTFCKNLVFMCFLFSINIKHSTFGRCSKDDKMMEHHDGGECQCAGLRSMRSLESFEMIPEDSDLRMEEDWGRFGADKRVLEDGVVKIYNIVFCCWLFTSG